MNPSKKVDCYSITVPHHNLPKGLYYLQTGHFSSNFSSLCFLQTACISENFQVQPLFRPQLKTVQRDGHEEDPWQFRKSRRSQPVSGLDLPQVAGRRESCRQAGKRERIVRMRMGRGQASEAWEAGRQMRRAAGRERVVQRGGRLQVAGVRAGEDGEGGGSGGGHRSGMAGGCGRKHSQKVHRRRRSGAGVRFALGRLSDLRMVPLLLCAPVLEPNFDLREKRKQSS